MAIIRGEICLDAESPRVLSKVSSTVDSKISWLCGALGLTGVAQVDSGSGEDMLCKDAGDATEDIGD